MTKKTKLFNIFIILIIVIALFSILYVTYKDKQENLDLSSIGNWVNQAGQDISNWGQQAGQDTSKFFQTVVNNPGEAGRQIVGNTTDLFKGIGKSISEANIGADLYRTGQNIRDKGLLGGITDSISKSADVFAQNVLDSSDRAKNWSKEDRQKYKQGAKNAFQIATYGGAGAGLVYGLPKVSASAIGYLGSNQAALNSSLLGAVSALKPSLEKDASQFLQTALNNPGEAAKQVFYNTSDGIKGIGKSISEANIGADLYRTGENIQNKGLLGGLTDSISKSADVFAHNVLDSSDRAKNWSKEDRERYKQGAKNAFELGTLAGGALAGTLAGKYLAAKNSLPPPQLPDIYIP
jgi:hypothetical protein